MYQVHFMTWIFWSCVMESFFSLIDAIFCCLYFWGLQIWLTERTRYYNKFVAIILCIQETEIFLEILKSTFFWHTGSPDHEINRLICDVMRQNFRNWKTGSYHSYPFLRVASVVAFNRNAPHWHLFSKLDTFFLVSKVTRSLIYVMVS